MGKEVLLLPAIRHQTQEARVIPLFGPERVLKPREVRGTDTFELARVVGPIGIRQPELADDLIDAIGLWLEVRRVAPSARRERLLACLELLELSPYEPDPRD